ncbi:MAG: phosphoglycerate dehydrogenase [Bacteroidetes bacterium]|nr:phosphoglycerate dehydrogenase [Bacteroidota bacterium]
MKQKTSYPKDQIKVLLLEGVHKRALEMFQDAGYTDIEHSGSTLNEDELAEKIKGAHILGIRSKTKVSAKVLANADKLMAIGAFCIGTNQIDMKIATEKGMAVFNSPFSNTRSVAELVIAEAILLMRKVVDKNKAMHDGNWTKSSSGSLEARGKTIGIIGYGHIGAQVSVMAESLGMNVIFYDVEPKLALGNARQSKNLDELLKQADVVTLHAPGHASTKHMINAERLKQMKKGAILINCGRGDLIEEEAVKNSLQEKHLGGLGLDVYATEPKTNKEPFATVFQNLENVFLTPHIGGSTVEAQENIGIDGASKLISYLETGSTVGSLTIPALNLPVQDDTHRMLHIHENVPGVLGEINTLMSKMNVNILAQYLKTNSQVGYVVLDIDKNTSPAVLDELRKVKHTIRVRNLY